MFCQFPDDTFWIGTRFVNLVDGHDDWNIGSLGVVDGLDGLRHNAVIRSHNQDGQVRYRGTAGPHRSKGRVSWCIQEGDFLAIFFDLVGTDMLGDTTSFPCCHTGVTQGIQEGGFTMVNVSHDGDNWRTFDQFLFIEVAFFDEETLDIS